MLGSGLNEEIAKKQIKNCSIWFCKQNHEGNKFKRTEQKQVNESFCQICSWNVEEAKKQIKKITFIEQVKAV